MKNKIKNSIFKAVAVIVLLISATSMYAQDKNTQTVKENTKDKRNYALLVSNEEHIKVAVKTAKQMFNDPKYKVGKMELVICGKGVETIKKEGTLTQTIEEGKAAGVIFNACGISLEKANLTLEQLVPGIEVVPNGLLRIFDLQAAGYQTIEL